MLTGNYICQCDMPDISRVTSKNKQELKTYLSLMFDTATEKMQAMNEADWQQEVLLFGFRQSTKKEVLFLMKDHTTHHRGQLIVYLRMLNIKPPPFKSP